MRKLLFLIFILMFASIGSVFAEGEGEQPTTEGTEEVVETTEVEESAEVEETTDVESTSIRISPAVIEIETPVEQGTKDYLTDFTVTNDSQETQVIEVEQEGHLKPNETNFELAPGEEKKVSVSFDISESQEVGETTDKILFKATAEGQEPLNYRVEATYNVVEKSAGFSLPVNVDLKVIGGIVIGVIIVILIILLSARKKSNQLYQLYEPKKKK